MVHTNIIYITLNYKYTLYVKVAYTSYFANSLNISVGKTLVFNFSILFTYLFISKKPYYNSGLFLNGSINLISISL